MSSEVTWADLKASTRDLTESYIADAKQLAIRAAQKVFEEYDLPIIVVKYWVSSRFNDGDPNYPKMEIFPGCDCLRAQTGYFSFFYDPERWHSSSENYTLSDSYDSEKDEYCVIDGEVKEFPRLDASHSEMFAGLRRAIEPWIKTHRPNFVFRFFKNKEGHLEVNYESGVYDDDY